MTFQRNSWSNGKPLWLLLLIFLLIATGCTVRLINNRDIKFPENSTDETTPEEIRKPQDNVVVSVPSSSATSIHTVSPTNIPSPSAITPTPNIMTFYVSKEGNNADGQSWKTAWNELDQIQWDKVNPGNMIIIDGGEYHTGMAVGKSGVPGIPITITTNGEQVVINGQNSTLPYCGESVYTSITSGDGINLEGRSFIVIDGQAWSGFLIRNHDRGIMMREGASNIVVRNVEIYNNGWSIKSGLNTKPDGPGVELGGSDILFERVIIHDNGQDAFQSGWGVWNFTLRRSWLYNSREHPIERGMPFNYCSHTDGIQIYDGGLQGSIVIEESIIGPSLTQGIMINNKVIVNDVIVEDTLFVGNTNAAIAIQNGGDSSNWTLKNVTIVQDATYESWNVKMRGRDHRILSSMFWGGPWGIGIFNWSDATGNYHWLTPDRYDVAVELDPMFIDDEYSDFEGEGFAEFNFMILNPTIPQGTGSKITSVQQLLISE